MTDVTTVKELTIHKYLNVSSKLIELTLKKVALNFYYSAFASVRETK